MKYFTLLILLQVFSTSGLFGQDIEADDKTRKDLVSLIDSYSEARENQDTVLLKTILTVDIDQLVSTGEWRTGIKQSVEGMKRSSETNQGTRTLTVEKIRLLDPHHGIVDARYEIANPDGSSRKMWSTFIVVLKDNRWKITGIRNMLPTGSD
ncbi:DUF4440 domain-containing protein [Negadavirga shengliensis]|uniref:DUF4440 domain-containing protein n=1 Tax=Negadavirga shengliensis TaxID=1389218 RepID=A0ABV9T6N2_9BACT